MDTMRSYGLAASPDMTARELQDLSDAWQAKLPEAHASFYSKLALSFTCGDYFFTHAGVKPGVPLKKQVERDLIWIRDEFLQSDKWFGKLVVHGHTPVPEPDFRQNRINIDTGAYATGRLTCLVLEKTDRTIL
jgi:serine/threonine protein phosphatase 1